MYKYFFFIHSFKMSKYEAAIDTFSGSVGNTNHFNLSKHL